MVTAIVNKLSIEDYNPFQMLTKLKYESGLIKEQSTSELNVYNMSYTKPGS
jgi:hypothetical protein